jgi:GNAT superfamily N-acetyltransferase
VIADVQISIEVRTALDAEIASLMAENVLKHEAIRPATMDDLPHILRMGYAFWQQTGATHIPWDVVSVEQLVQRLIEDENSLLLMAGTVGMTAAIVYPHYWNNAYIVGQEVFWWIDPEYRRTKLGLELFRALEQWAKERAHSFTMIALETSQPERMARFYQASGYKPLEIHFTRTF